MQLRSMLKLLALERHQSAGNATKAEQWRLRSLELSKQGPHLTGLFKALTSEEDEEEEIDEELLQAMQRVLGVEEEQEEEWETEEETCIAQIANAAGGLGSAIWDFLTLIITLLPKLGARVVNILAMVAMVFVALYIFISRGFGDYLVRATQMAVIGFVFPNSSAVVKEF